MKVTKLSDYRDTPGVQPVDYHKFDEDQWDKALRRGQRIAYMLMTAVGVAFVGLIVALISQF